MKKLLSPSVMFSFILALVMAIVLDSNYYALPDVVPTHWNALGKADSWGENIPFRFSLQSLCVRCSLFSLLDLYS